MPEQDQVHDPQRDRVANDLADERLDPVAPVDPLVRSGEVNDLGSVVILEVRDVDPLHGTATLSWES